MDKDLLSIPEFCDAIGVGRSYVYKLLKRRELAALKIGRRTFITKTAAKEWLAGLTAYSAKPE